MAVKVKLGATEDTQQEKPFDCVDYKGNYIVSPNGNVYSKIQKRLLKGTIDFFGYKYITINASKEKVHRIIASLFIPNPENKPCVNHINGVKSDNRVENLEWSSYSENNKHAYETGLKSSTDNQRLCTSLANSKKVIDAKSGEIYNSAKDAANSINIKPNTLVSYLIGRSKNKTNFSYIEQPITIQNA
jgi:hypothetical protein